VEIYSLGTDGRVVSNNLSLTGAADGNNISLSNTQLSIQVLRLSGTLGGNTLTLTGGFTGGQPSTIVMVRSSLSEYQAQVSALNEKSKSILAAKAAAAARENAARQEQQVRENAIRQEQQVIAAIDQLVSRMQRFNIEADEKIGKFPAAEQRFQAITRKMAEYLERELRMADNSNASAARGQLSVAISQGSVATEQLHNEVASLETSFEVNAQPVMKSVTEYEQACRTAHPSQAVDAACQRLFAADGTYRNKFDGATSGLAHLEATYQDERKAQEKLLLVSQQIQ
jgi:hypothetical protein